MDASVVKFECDSENGGCNNRLDANINQCETQGDAEALHSQIFPQYMHVVSSSYNGQSAVMDNEFGEQTSSENSAFWTPEGFQEASCNDDRTQLQPQQTSNFSIRPQKSTKLWLGSRRLKRRSSMYGSKLKCPHCPETFLHKPSLSRHIMINHGPKVYFWCKRCCRFYNRRDNLRYHYRNHHPKYIRDLDHIQGVGRKRLQHDEQPSSSKTNNEPLEESNCSIPSSSNQLVSRNGNQLVARYSTPQSSGYSTSNTTPTTTKVAAKPQKIQAAQLTKRELEAVGTQQETLRIGTAFVNTRDGISNPQSAARQSGIKPTSERQLPILSVPPAGVSWESKRPCVKAHTIPSADARSNFLTVTDVLAYQLQRESNNEDEDEDVVEILDDSSSDGELEPPLQIPSQGPGDEDVERLERGTPFKDLKIEKVMEGQVTRVTEEHQTYIYSRGKKIRTERRKRIYNVLHLDGVGQGTKQTLAAVSTSPSLTEIPLETNVKGRVTKVTERSSKYTYSSGQKVMKEKTSRVYDVMLLAGLTNI